MTEYERLEEQHREMKRAQQRSDNKALFEAIDNLTAERDQLRAKIAAMESQLINCRPSVKNDLNNFDRFMLRKYNGRTPNDGDAAELARLIALLDYIDSLAHGAAPKVESDPCPGCRHGVVCRTPLCGRLKLPLTHPSRATQKAAPATSKENT